MKKYYPFSALVGQDDLLLGVILNIINPNLGGLLIKGVKGSGKSTAVYAMTDIIPSIKVFKDCDFNCDPDKDADNWCKKCKERSNNADSEIISKKVTNVSIPLSITEDRLLGNVDVEMLLKKGENRFIPGLLAKAHRQILYIDEVNLLPDHIIDDILDVSAMGWNKIEREGFSISHPSEFLLVGTMNPEEGELRPQILDRFPLSVEVKSVTSSSLRKEIINRNLAFENNPDQFIAMFQEENEKLKGIINLARTLLKKVKINASFFDIVVDLCSKFNVDGHRADIGIIKTAKTYAAFELKKHIELRHIIQSTKFVLMHRTREGGLAKPLTEDEINQYFDNLKINETSMERSIDTNLVNKDISLFSNNKLIELEKK